MQVYVLLSQSEDYYTFTDFVGVYSTLARAKSGARLDLDTHKSSFLEKIKKFKQIKNKEGEMRWEAVIDRKVNPHDMRPTARREVVPHHWYLILRVKVDS